MDTKLLRQKILDLAIHGKLVPQNPADEPASVLFERIKAEKERLIKAGKIKKSAKTSDTPHYDNVPFEVPKNWVWTTLGEIFTLQAGKNITSQQISSVIDLNHPFPCYGGNGLRGFVDKFNKEGRYPLIGRQGALCGNINEANGQFYATEHAVVVDTYCKTNIDWAINTLKYLNLNQYATSTAQPGLAVSTINEVLIPLPPIEEQTRIIEILKKWFSLIDVIESSKNDLQSTIKQTKSKILDLAIHGKLVPQNPKDEPAIELLKRINPNAEINCDNGQPNQLPQGWAVCRINDISDSSLGKTLDKSKDTGNFKPYLCSINVKWLDFDFSTLKEFRLEENELERYLVKRGDLLVCEGGDVGRAAIWNSDDEIYYQNALHRIRFKEGISASFFLYYLFFLKNSGVLDDLCKGVTIKHLTQNAMRLINFYLPPLAEQQRIVTKIEELFAVLDNIQKSLES